MSQLWVVFFVQKKLKIGHLKSSAYSQTRSQQHLVVRDDSAHFKQLIEWWGVSGCCICMYLRCFMQMNVLCPRKMNTGQTIQAGPGCKASNRGKSWVSHCMYQQDSTGITFVFGHFFQEKACHKITTADHFWFLFIKCVGPGVIDSDFRYAFPGIRRTAWWAAGNVPRPPLNAVCKRTTSSGLWEDVFFPPKEVESSMNNLLYAALHFRLHWELKQCILYKWSIISTNLHGS